MKVRELHLTQTASVHIVDASLSLIQTKKSEETHTDHTDQTYSLVTSKPGESCIFPGEPKEYVEAKPKRKKKLLSKKQRESALKTHVSVKSSEEDSVSKKSEKKDSNKEIEDKKVKVKESEITDKQLNNMTKPPDVNLLEQSDSVTEVPMSQDKDDVGKELISPIVLGPEGKPLLNLQVMKKLTFVPREPPIKKKKVLATQHATKSKHAKTSTPTEVPREGVLLITQGGKAIYSLGKVKIGKNVRSKSPASVATKNVVESARTVKTFARWQSQEKSLCDNNCA